MPAVRSHSIRLLPDGTPLHNRLLAALPRADYDRILPYVKMNTVRTGETLQAHRVRIKDVYFPNGGVFSITNEMQNGGQVEVATVGREGMLGIGVFFGDRAGIGRAFRQVPNGLRPSRGSSRRPGAPDRFAMSSASTLRRTCCRSCSAPRATRCTASPSDAADGFCRRAIASTTTPSGSNRNSWRSCSACIGRRSRLCCGRFNAKG
jgi:hypothetical protein